MLNFFYDSLETVKKLKFPTIAEYIQMTIAVFVLIIVASILFMVTDTVFGQLYQAFYFMFYTA